jgi:hypothetical protein
LVKRGVREGRERERERERKREREKERERERERERDRERGVRRETAQRRRQPTERSSTSYVSVLIRRAVGYNFSQLNDLAANETAYMDLASVMYKRVLNQGAKDFFFIAKYPRGPCSV